MLTASAAVSAQDSTDVRRSHVGLMLDSREDKVRQKLDTAYITLSEGRWTIKVRGNISGSGIVTRNIGDGGKVMRTAMNSDMKGTMSFSVGYRGLTIGLAANPARWIGRYKDLEFNLNSYGAKFGFDIIYNTANTYQGDIISDGQKVGYIRSGDVGMKSLIVDAYYAFNSRRFSYPAAFSQSQLQKRSAGSWLLGLSLTGGRMRHNGNSDDGQAAEEALLVNARQTRLDMMLVSVGGGYGHNFVARHGWMFHISAMPHLVVHSHVRRYDADGEPVSAHWRFPNFVNVFRGAVVRNFGSRWFRSQFIGMSFVVHNSVVGNLGSMSMAYTKWRGRLFWGFRL